VTAPLAFSQAAIRRAVEGVKSAGEDVTAVEVRPDGTILVHTVPIAAVAAPEGDAWDNPRA
jgi:hypothetical protein